MRPGGEQQPPTTQRPVSTNLLRIIPEKRSKKAVLTENDATARPGGRLSTGLGRGRVRAGCGAAEMVEAP